MLTTETVNHLLCNTVIFLWFILLSSSLRAEFFGTSSNHVTEIVFCQSFTFLRVIFFYVFFLGNVICSNDSKCCMSFTTPTSLSPSTNSFRTQDLYFQLPPEHLHHTVLQLYQSNISKTMPITFCPKFVVPTIYPTCVEITTQLETTVPLSNFYLSHIQSPYSINNFLNFLSLIFLLNLFSICLHGLGS